ncbi:E3 ubiquitin-protein ligase, putative [Plasmodium sp. gorilla clade G3]|nr:E3 ubiquitin-protein ligase, putative [Plasmodium sp. gorilla clade G3]
MSFIDEYDLDMYKNIVMANNCKDEELLCIFNTSSFLNTICFFLFAIYMKNMSRYIDDIKMLCRSHVNDIIRIKKKITPRHVEKINLNISINNNIQLFKNYLSSSSNDLNNFYKYSISFTFSSKNCIYIRLFFGVLLEEINDMIYNKTESYRNLNYHRDDENNQNINYHNNLYNNNNNNNNTVICIDNFKNFFREGFIKTLPNNKKNSSDATTFLLDNEKNDIFITNENYIENIIDFHTCYYKTSKSFHTSGTDMTYTMPYDENFCVTDILNRIEIEKKQKDENNSNNHSNNYSNNSSNNNSPNNDDNIYNNNNNSIYNHLYSDNLMFNNDISRDYRNNHLDTTNNNIFLSNEHTNRYKNNKVFLQNDSKILNSTNIDENIRIPLIIVLNDVPPTDEYYGNKENIKNNYNNINTTTTTTTTTMNNNNNNNNMNSYNNNYNNCNTLIVLVGFQKIKDKYKPFIIKDISVLSYNLSEQYNNLKKKKKKKGKSTSNNNYYNNQIYQFVDILDIYGHEEHDKECLICMTSYKDTLLMPCRHSSFCYDCMKSLRQEKCPICRCLFTSFIKFPLKNVDRVDT